MQPTNLYCVGLFYFRPYIGRQKEEVAFLAKSMFDIHRSYSAMSQFFSKRTTMFPSANGSAYPAQLKARPTPAALLNPGLAAVYEKSGKLGVTPSLPQTYKHPQTDKTGQYPAGKLADRPFHERNKSLHEQSKALMDRFTEDLQRRSGAVTAEAEQKWQIRRNQWLSEQRKDAADQPGLGSRLTEGADKHLEQLGGKLWSAMELELNRHKQAGKSGDRQPDPIGQLLKAARELREWNKSLRRQSSGYLEDFNEKLDRMTGRVSDKQLDEMKEELDRWLFERRVQLAGRLEDFPEYISKPVLEVADRRLERLEDKLWSQMREAVRRHNASVPPNPKPTPAEQAEKIYNDWNQSLRELTNGYLDSLRERLNDLGAVVDDEQKQQMEAHLYRWIGEQREQLENSLSELPYGIVKKFLKTADQSLENVTDSMWGSIEEMITRHNGAIRRAEELYGDWNQLLGGQARDYFDAFQENLRKFPGAIGDEQKRQMYQGMTDWLTRQRHSLKELLNGSPDGILRVLLERADEHLDNLRDHLWSRMEEEIRKHNLSVPPSPPPVQVPFPADAVFRPGRIKIEVTEGNRKAILLLNDPSSLTRGQTMFYVVDALGNKKAVSITFNDARLQEEFTKRFKSSSMYGKTVSLEKFNRFLDKLKSALKETIAVDLERLRSQIFEKDEASRLDVMVKNFAHLLGKMKL
jgi:hypothetical protein